jgi:hypothetical protein
MLVHYGLKMGLELERKGINNKYATHIIHYTNLKYILIIKQHYHNATLFLKNKKTPQHAC